MDVAEWLRGLGFEQYVPAFRDNDIDGEVLRRLTADDLRELGVASIGHRRRLLDAIAALGEGQHAAEAKPIPADAGSSEAERRQLSVMFCDLVGSTPLSSRLDPEDLREVIGAYHRTVADTVGRFAGFVAKYMGDGVLVYFGYPQAHEDDAERAVRTGLALVDAVAAIEVAEVKLSVRIGVATGIVVVGDLIGSGSSQEQAVVGETPNLAARLQALAEPNTVVIGPRTQGLLGNLFEYRNLGYVELKGFAEPARAYQVLRPSALESRFEALRSTELTPLVGREEEIELLLRRWQRAKSGDGQVVLLSGEPGIGKSRIAIALLEKLQTEPHVRLRYFCSPYYTESALHPTISQLEYAAGFEREDTPAVKLDKLAALLTRTAATSEEVALLAELLSLPVADADAVVHRLSSQQKKERTFAAIETQLEALARQAPVVMLFEDAHWADPSSRDLLDRVVERVAHLRVLLVITFRPEYDPPWAGSPHVALMTLNRLGRREGAALVASISGGKALPAAIVSEIVERTDGVPLFAEELTKAVLEAGADEANAERMLSAVPGLSLAVPATLHASLLARLDRLGGAAKQVAQIGSAIGREFSYELLAIVAQRNDGDLQAELRRLLDTGLVFCRGTPPEATYIFKHALVQDTAYQSLLRARRQQLHRRIAEALERTQPAIVSQMPEALARHYSAASMFDRAVEFWLRAGERSYRRSAVSETVSQLQNGLDLIRHISDNEQRHRQEIGLLTTLGSALKDLRSYSHPDVTKVYARVRDLCGAHGYGRQAFPALLGEAINDVARARFAAAHRTGCQLLRIARLEREPVLLVEARYALGVACFPLGKFRAARRHFESGLARYDRANHAAHIAVFGQDGGAICKIRLALTEWYIGYPEKSLSTANEALALAEEIEHPFTTAYVKNWAALAFCHLGDPAATVAAARGSQALSSDHGFSYWPQQNRILLAWVAGCEGDRDAAVDEMVEALADLAAMGVELIRPFWCGLLAREYVKLGRASDALATLQAGIEAATRHEQAFPLAELYRMRGELLCEMGRVREAEIDLRDALGVASKQQARLPELRAATSLARLWSGQGRGSEARDLLAPIYGWFTEGFDTADLKEAIGLLHELM